MIGFHISLGYCPDFPPTERDQLMVKFRQVMRNLSVDKDRIIQEVLRVEPWMGEHMEELEEMAELCGDRNDLSVSSIDSDGEFKHYLPASGSMMKEKQAVRRAMVRMFIEEMHRLRINVNVVCS